MPYINTAACVLGDCSAPAFPVTTGACFCDLAVGGIGELYIIPCTEVLSEANVVDSDWWAGLITDNKLGRMGKGVGSIAKGTVTKARTSSCSPEQIVGIEWNLTFTERCFDKTSAATTQARYTELINNYGSYLVVARMCDGDETVLPIGRFTTTDTDWVVPETNEEVQSVQIVLTWKQKAIPAPVVVPGLALVLPKAA